tara:strand:- start:112475 stop:112786 length:312 start_codon:yes stop_codon:yes gene_type:complete
MEGSSQAIYFYRKVLKMAYSFVIDPRAIKDIQEAIDYYEEQQAGIGIYAPIKKSIKLLNHYLVFQWKWTLKKAPSRNPMLFNFSHFFKSNMFLKLKQYPCLRI